MDEKLTMSCQTKSAMNCTYVAKLLKDYWQMVINNEEDIIVYLYSEAVKYTVHGIR